jgi:hypothetical protein
MCAQQTAADMPSAGLNIAELADQYTRPVRGIGHQYRLTREEQEDAAQSTWLALCQTPIRSATHDVSRMAGHHDAPILRRGHPPPTPRIPRLEWDRYLRPDGRGTRASRRRGHETRYGSAASGHHSTTRAGTTPHPAAIRSCQSRIYADQPQHAYAHRKHRTHPRPGPSPTTNPSPRPRVAVHTTTAANSSWRRRQQGRHRHAL